MGEPSAVVLVHGLWMTGTLDMAYLRRQLRRCGFKVYVYRYRTVRRSLAENASRLNGFLARLPEPTVHLVGHSMGGRVIRKLFLDFPDQRPGRVVTLGAPHCASRAAAAFGRRAPGRWLLGKGLQALTGALPPWQGQREFGVLIGDLPYGLGRLTRRLPLPNDGTVAVDEATLADVADTVTLPVTHISMLFSGAVARQTCHFLRHGRFLSGHDHRAAPE
ncbi:MAG: alpha/beta fold hydrolase [Hydrogenophaga sp.]